MKNTKKKNRFSKSFHVDVYEANVNIGVCSNDDELERWYNDLTETEEDEEDGFFPVVALSFYDDNGENWIIFTKENFDLNTCAHECFHLTHHFMDDIHNTFSLDSHEPHAWLHGFFMKHIHGIAEELLKKFK